MKSRAVLIVGVLVAALLALPGGAPVPQAQAGTPNKYSLPQWMPLRGAFVVGCTYDNGCTNGYHGYPALDLARNSTGSVAGDPVYAAGAGLATIFQVGSTCGGSGTPSNAVKIDHGSGVTSYYYHLQGFAFSGSTWVDENDVIGSVGNTGSVDPCTFNHLHFEVHNGETKVDPGQLKACIGDRLTTYPAEFGSGKTTWNQAPKFGAIQNDGTACVPAVPGAPSIVGIPFAGSSGEALVAWAPPAADGGSPVTGYTVTASPGGASVNVPASARSVWMTGLSNGTAYTFRVRATNAVGAGAESEPSLAVAPRATGLLRVTTSPALPSQVLVDGVPVDSWGLSWVKVAVGSHTVSFTHVEGYSEPAPQTVNVTAGATSTVTGVFTQRGSLRVITSPSVPSTIKVDGLVRDAWGMWTDIPAGAHQVCFGAVANFDAPVCQDVTVTAGALSTVTGNFVSHPGLGGPTGKGLVRVTTSPALPSQISLDGIPANSWGLTRPEVAPGNHTVCFSHIEGYTEPACQVVNVVAGATSTVTGTFTQRGSLRVITSPAVPATIYVDGVPRDDWGMWTDLPAGAHQVCFGTVATFTTPQCQNVTLTAGNLTTVTANYTKP